MPGIVIPSLLSNRRHFLQLSDHYIDLKLNKTTLSCDFHTRIFCIYPPGEGLSLQNFFNDFLVPRCSCGNAECAITSTQ